jgi:hypothetical protein
MTHRLSPSCSPFTQGDEGATETELIVDKACAASCRSRRNMRGHIVPLDDCPNTFAYNVHH